MRYILLVFSLVFWLAIGRFFLALDSIVDLIHFTSIPFLGTYLLLFEPMVIRKNYKTLCVFTTFTILLIASYFVAFSITISDIKFNWIELPIAVYFLLSVYAVLWLFDRFISLIFNTVLIIRNKTIQILTKNTLRIGVLIFAVVPYVVALFLTHWVKFSDSTNPKMILNMDYKQVSFTAKDGKQLNGWYILPEHRVSDSTVLIVPGRSQTKNLFLSYAKIFSESGYNVLLFDLRGNGNSSGHKYSFSVNEVNDVLGAVDYLKINKAGSSKYVFGFGINEGASALIAAASIDERFSAIVSDNATGYEIAVPQYMSGYLPQWMEKNLLKTTKTFVHLDIGKSIPGIKGMYKKIAQISPCPVLVANSIRNEKSDRMRTLELYTMAKEPKRLWLTPSEGNRDPYSQYFLNILETFNMGKEWQQTGKWRISKIELKIFKNEID